MKKRKFKEGGTSALEDAAEGKGGRFGKDVYQRALEFRKNVDKEDRGFTPETRKASPSPAPAPKAEAPAPSPSGVSSGRGNAVGRGADDDVKTSSAPAPAPAAKSSRAEIPVDTSLKAPAESDPEGRMDMSDTERNLRNLGNALSPFGAGLAGRAAAGSIPSIVRGARAGRADANIAKAISKSADDAPLSAAKPSMAETAKSAQRFTPKEELAAAESTVRGAASRAAIRAKRAERQAASAKAMEEGKPILQASPKRASPRSRTRDEGVEYTGLAKGGSVRGGGCEQRGKTRGRMY